MFKENNSTLNKKMESIYNSKIWRVTAPLRWIQEKYHSTLFSRDTELRDDANQITTDIDVPADTNITSSPHKILLVSYYCPTRGHAGGLRILDLYAFIRSNYPSVQIDIFTHHRPSIDWKINDIYDIFDNVYLSPNEDLTPQGLGSLMGGSKFYNVIDLQFHQSGYNIDSFRKIGSKVIYTPMESLAKSFYFDVRGKSPIKNLFLLSNLARALRHAAEELVCLPKADEVVCVSRADAAFLKAVTSSKNIRGLDTGVSNFEFADALSSKYIVSPAAERPLSVLYIAYFGSETNTNALRWYLGKVHPLVKEAIPNYKFTIVGRGDLSSFAEQKDDSIDMVGEVETLAPYIQNSRVCIAPALGGAGLRGKINQYAVMGVPTVVSPISHRGLAYQDGENIFVAETPTDFADRCIQLLEDTELNDKMGLSARLLCLKRYTWKSKSKLINKIYNLEALDE
jgi:glycosyltransferase involved in cell wall biosynthesis